MRASRLARVLRLLFAAALLATASNVVAQNLLQNGSFDAGIEGWTGSGGTLTILFRPDTGSTLAGGSGPGCVEVRSDYLNEGHGGTRQEVEIGPGAHLEMAVSYFLPSGDNRIKQASVSVSLENANGDVVDSAWMYSEPVVWDQWTRISMAVEPPPSAVRADVGLRVQPVAGAEGDPPAVAYFDDAWLAQEGTGTSYQELFVPAAAAVHGSNSTYWSTSAWFGSLVDTEVTVSAALLEPGWGNTDRVAAPILLGTVGPRGFLEIQDVVSALGGTEVAAGLYIVATAEGEAVGPDLVRVTTHTFTPNPFGDGGYGQGIAAEGFGTGGSATVAGVFQGERFRTNIGVLSTTAKSIPVRVVVRDTEGTPVADDTWTLSPFGQRQVSLPSLGVDGLAGGTVTFATSHPTHTYHAYASTVDQRSGDAVFNLAR